VSQETNTYTKKITLSDKTAGAIDTSWVELDKLQILQRKASTSNHCITVTRTSVCTRAAEICPTVTSGCEDRFVCPEAVERAILHVERDDPDTLAVLHDQVEGKVFNEEIRVVSQRLAVKGMEESVTSTISSRRTTVCLTTFAILQRLTTKGTLVNLPILGTGEWNTIMFKLRNGDKLRGKYVKSDLTSITDLGASRHI